ncbi:hypothetical protein M433DRAFT_60134 [Acidomyces richmondensis BFW]|nr:MAG: hypothetical protein FE78DRAFT_156905 [Acidomyces sp. 'richmondensis']KYG48935.1 hypothetical protein M433DRAFT_60134 [Acidomyces richmondensis BFW]
MAFSLRRVLTLPSYLRHRLYSTTPASTSNLTPEIYDIVTIGGGPVGLSFVAALRSHPSTRHLKIALIDSQDLTSRFHVYGENAADFSNRCSSLTPTSVRYLKDIGAWGRINEDRVQPYYGMEVWDGVSGSRIRFDGWEQQRESGGVVATMCENANLTTALLQLLHSSSPAADTGTLTILDKTKVSSIQLGPNASNSDPTSPDLSQWPIIQLPNHALAARLLVGADGASSPVRSFANIASPGWDYAQHGVVATLTLSHPSRIAYQRFLPTGPIALLPLPGNAASLVWSTTPSHAATLKSLPPPAVAALVNAAFRLLPVDLEFILTHLPNNIEDEIRWRVGATPGPSTGLPETLPHVTGAQESSIASFPLKMRHADTYTAPRVALIGDAAHTVHPLAGQGLNLGLADSAALSSLIANGVRRGMDIGSEWCLEGYNSARWAQNSAVLGVCDKLQKIYSVGSGPVVWGRSLGVNLLERMGMVKGWLMGAAGGGPAR